MPRLRAWWLLGPALIGLVAFTASRAGIRSYEVQLAFVGHSSLSSSDECPARVNEQGYDSLTGTVKGLEPDGKSDDEVLYQGVLRRTTRLDYCGNVPKPCIGRLVGEAQMTVEIRVDGEEGRGARMNAKAVMGSVKTLRVEGDCPAAAMEEFRKEYPGGTSGASPDGQDIPESDPPRFFVAGVPRLRVGYFPTDKDHPSWSLRVVRAVP